jgi:hypothetical protein
MVMKACRSVCGPAFLTMPVAQVAKSQPQDNVRVLLDPAGRPFCLSRDDEE